MKSDRTSISYLSWFAFPVLTYLIVAVPLSIFLEPISGDLTRIGYWSERDFGWNKAQPEVAVQANGALSSNPQVLVLGDSFSHPNIWQSYLAESQHLEILSFQYQDVGCVDNWLNWVLDNNYSNMRTVIIQVVERSFVPVFRNLNRCASRVPVPFEVAEEHITVARPDSGLTLDATYLFATATNMFRMAWSDDRIVSAGVVNAPLSSDSLFSNRKSNRLLYYAEDENKMSWSEKDMTLAVGNLKSIQGALDKRGLNLVVIVVPDKSSAYRNYLADEKNKDGYPDIFEQLKASDVNNVNLLGFFQYAVGETVDLYLPNDTHLSVQGYKLMALKVSDELF